MAVTATWQSNSEFANASADTSHTYLAMGIGTAAADRLVFVAVACQQTSSPFSGRASGVTIQGIAATQIVAGSFGSWWWAAVPTGTTADIIVTHASWANTGAISVYSVTGSSLSTPVYQSATFSGSSPSTQTISSPANGAILGAGFSVTFDTSASVSCTWTALTEDLDNDYVNSIIHFGFSSASLNSAAAQNSLSVQLAGTGTTSTAVDGVLISLSPPGIGVAGVAAAGGVGALSGTDAKTPGGVAGAGLAGAVASAMALTISGAAAVGSPGAMRPVVIVAPSGVAGTGAVGAFAETIIQALMGVAATGVIGSLSEQTSILGGCGGSGAAGALSRSIAFAMAGVTGTGVAGNLLLNLMVPIVGGAGAGLPGSLFDILAKSITGVVGVGSVSSASSLSVALQLIGASGSGMTGSFVSVSALVVGVSGSGFSGDVTISLVIVVVFDRIAYVDAEDRLAAVGVEYRIAYEVEDFRLASATTENRTVDADVDDRSANVNEDDREVTA